LRAKTSFRFTVDSSNIIKRVTVRDALYESVSNLKGRSIFTSIHPDYLDFLQDKLSDKSFTGVFDIIFGESEGSYIYLNAGLERPSKEYAEISFCTPEEIVEPSINTDNEELINVIYENAGVFFRADRFGNLIFIAERGRDVFGLDIKLLIGWNIRDHNYLREGKYESLREQLTVSGKISGAVVPLKDFEGNIRWIKLSSVGRFEEDGTYTGAFGYAKEVTSEKGREEELAHMQNLLELKQKELDSLTVSMKYKVQSQVSKGRREEESILYHARLAEMGEMVGSIAHQWRQPLSALMFIIEDIRDAYHFGELDVSYLDDAIDECMSYIRFMSDTMDDFRNFFRPEPEKEQFNIVEKLLEVVKMQYGRFEVGAVNVDIDCDLTALNSEKSTLVNLEYGRGISVFNRENLCTGAGIIVYGYPNLFKQVIINLINNSIDSILEKRSAGELGATDAGYIHICVTGEKGKVLIDVEDNGVGLKENDVDQIFEPEYTTKPKKQGTGIGLHMAKSIVEKSLSGKIRAANGEYGALFTIEVPCVSVVLS